MPVTTALRMRALDDKDRHILTLLQEDGRMSLTTIAKAVKLSIDSVHNRIDAMVAKDVFQSRIFVNPRAIGYPLIADIKIKLHNITEEEKTSLLNYLQQHPHVIELLSVMGDFDLTCVLIAKDTDEFEHLSTTIRHRYRGMIADWRAILVLKTHKFEQYDLLALGTRKSIEE